MSVGARIENDGHLATVLFVGQIAGTKGDWLGVEWDDTNRGKHNGTHDGIQYFTASHPTSGSFIRPKKANLGISLLKALENRYGLVDDERGGVDVDEMFFVDERNRQTTIEVVGAHSVNQQQSQFDKLLKISFRHTGVHGAGDPGLIRNTIPIVEELDLSKNLLRSWEVIASIAEQLDSLHTLDVSENRLAFPEDTQTISPAFPSLKTIFLNRMNYTWKEVLKCLEILQQLHQLHVCFNEITTITDLGSHLDNVKIVNLEANPLRDWNEVLKLAHLPNLETLILINTGIDRVEFPDVPHGKNTSLFSRLRKLFISNNKITKWSSISELNKLRCMTELIFTKNPLLEEYSDDTMPRTLIIAKLAKLKLGNRTVVLGAERKGSELDYLKMYGRAWIESGGHQIPEKNKPSEAFTQEHPRYQQLINIHGAPEDSELKVQSTALKNNLINLVIDSPNAPNKAPLKKKLPVTMTVQKLKILVQRLYKADPITMKITYTSHRMPGQEIEMESDQKELDYYSIEEGDTMHISW